jgi:superfamily II DNA or RNA helicase
MIKPYRHQKRLIRKIRRAFRDGFKHVLAQSPTGSGKTVMFSFIASKAASKKNKVLIITDRFELLSQAGGTIESFNMDPYYISAGVNFIDRTKNTYIGMSQTLRNRLKKSIWKTWLLKDIGLVIIDECHVQEFNWLFETGLLDDKFVLGFTATPVRSGKMTQLALQYDKLINGEPIKNLIKKGYLVNCDTYDCGTPDLQGVRINYQKGDYAETSMFQRYDSPQLYKGLVKNYQRICPGQKMIVFCCNVEHAIKTTRKLNAAGINAKFICAKKNPPKEPRKWTAANEEIFKTKFKAYKLYQKYFYRFSGERDDIFDGFRNNEFDVLVNVDIATKGFDCPDIQVVALYRATTSPALYLQMVGRGGRRADGKTHFTVLDFGGNKERFGPYDADRDWTLWHEESAGGGVPPMKICGETSTFEKIKGAGKVKRGCETLILASAQICPFCGFKYPKRNKAQEIDLALAGVIDKNGVSIKDKAFKDMSFDELTQYRSIKKHHINWLYRMLWIRDGEQTIIEYANEYKWTNARLRKVLQICRDRYD